jgi:hypothetical protein
LHPSYCLMSAKPARCDVFSIAYLAEWKAPQIALRGFTSSEAD